MKKRITLGIIAVFLLSACANQESAKESDVSDVQTTESTKQTSVQRDEGQYLTVVDAYQSSLAVEEPVSEFINGHAIAPVVANEASISYALYDLSGDGKNELLIGLHPRSSIDGIKLIDLYIINEQNTLVKLTASDVGLTDIGDNKVLIPTKDGLFWHLASSADLSEGVALYRLTADGSQLELMEEVLYDGSVYKSSLGQTYTLDGLQSYIDQSIPYDLTSLDWIDILPFSTQTTSSVD